MLLVTPSNWVRCFSGAGSMSTHHYSRFFSHRMMVPAVAQINVTPHPSNRHLFLNTQGYPCHHTRAQLSRSITAAPFCLANQALLEDNCGSSASPPRKAIWKGSSEPSKGPGSMPKTPMMPGGCLGLQGKFAAVECSSDLWVGKIPWRRAWQPTPVFSPGEFPWTKEPGRLQRVGHDWAPKHSMTAGTAQIHPLRCVNVPFWGAEETSPQ